jgi:hypothetical protein
MKSQDLQSKLKEVTQVLGPAAKSFKGLQRVLATQDQDPLLLHGPLEEASALLLRLGQTTASLSLELDQARQQLLPALRDRQTTFGADLEDAFKEAGLKLHGRWPRWTSGPWQFLASDDLKTCELQWGPGVETLERFPVGVEAALEALRQQETQFASAHDPAALPPMLLAATRMATARLGLREGEPAPLNTVHACLAFLQQGQGFLDRPSRTSWKQDYSRARFSYDLSRLRGLRLEDQELRLRVATRDQTRKPGNAFWLPDDASGNGTLFHSVQFVKREDQVGR